MRTTKSNRTAAYYRRVSPDMVEVLDGVLFGRGAKVEATPSVGTPETTDGLKMEGKGGSGDSGEMDRLREEVKRLNDDLLVVDAGRADLRAENENLKVKVADLEFVVLSLRAENERLVSSGWRADAKLQEELGRCKAKVKEYERMYNGS